MVWERFSWHTLALIIGHNTNHPSFKCQSLSEHCWLCASLYGHKVSQFYNDYFQLYKAACHNTCFMFILNWFCEHYDECSVLQWCYISADTCSIVLAPHRLHFFAVSVAFKHDHWELKRLVLLCTFCSFFLKHNTCSMFVPSLSFFLPSFLCQCPDIPVCHVFLTTAWYFMCWTFWMFFFTNLLQWFCPACTSAT